jgi:hypothetical protein
MGTCSMSTVTGEGIQPMADEPADALRREVRVLDDRDPARPDQLACGSAGCAGLDVPEQDQRLLREVQVTGVVRLRALDAITARALGIRDGGALLARPDGVPAGAWPSGTDAAAALSAGIAAATDRACEPRRAALAA